MLLAVWIPVCLFCALLVSKGAGYFATDAQGRISTFKTLVSLAFLLPGAICLIWLLIKIGSSRKGTQKGILLVSTLLLLLPLAVWLYYGDGVRAICQTLGGFLMVMLAAWIKDPGARNAFSSLDQRVRTWLPIPEILYLIPFLVLTYWLVGFDPILPESLLQMELP